MKLPSLNSRTLALIGVLGTLVALFVYVALRSGPLAPTCPCDHASGANRYTVPMATIEPISLARLCRARRLVPQSADMYSRSRPTFAGNLLP